MSAPLVRFAKAFAILLWMCSIAAIPFIAGWLACDGHYWLIAALGLAWLTMLALLLTFSSEIFDWMDKEVER